MRSPRIIVISQEQRIPIFRQRLNSPGHHLLCMRNQSQDVIFQDQTPFGLGDTKTKGGMDGVKTCAEGNLSIVRT
jgi:hypothetical protein